MGVEVLTLYSFSTENWGRPEDEVQALMALLEEYLRDELEELQTNRVRLRAIGELDRLPSSVRDGLGQVCEITRSAPGLQLVLALSYGSRAEIVSAVRDIGRRVARGELDPEAITEATVSGALYAADLPDPDLLIRTSGELRLSNFLLWQIAYAELFVTEVAWPEFRGPHLDEAFSAYAARQRRFGRTSAQLEDP